MLVFIFISVHLCSTNAQKNNVRPVACDVIKRGELVTLAMLLRLINCRFIIIIICHCVVIVQCKARTKISTSTKVS